MRQAEGGTTLDAVLAQGACWECRGRLFKRMGDKRALASALDKALELRQAAINRTRSDPEEQRQHHVKAAELCFQLAGEVAARREYARAVELYEAAQKHDPPHVQSTLALARLHVANDEKDAAEAQCNALLALDASHDEATLMLANIMFQKEQFEAALFHFEELLKRNPHHYAALAQLVTLLRRAGRVSEIDAHIRTAEKARRDACAATRQRKQREDGGASPLREAPSFCRALVAA